MRTTYRIRCFRRIALFRDRKHQNSFWLSDQALKNTQKKAIATKMTLDSGSTTASPTASASQNANYGHSRAFTRKFYVEFSEEWGRENVCAEAKIPFEKRIALCALNAALS